MSRIKMDTDEVRAVAHRLRTNANLLDSHMNTIKAAIVNADWQSNARAEYVSNLETLLRVNSNSSQTMRLMASALDSKAQQWEEIARKFNGPFHYLQGLWETFKDNLSNTWQGLINIIGKINIPVFAVVSGTATTVIAWASILNRINGLDWPPKWWPPFGNNGEQPSIGGAGVNDHPTPPPKVEEPPVIIDNKPYPQPPTQPMLGEATRDGKSYTCATYAAARRPDLGSTQCDNEKWKDQAAANYICKYEDKAYQIGGTDSDLTKAIGPGYALVWEPSHAYADDTYGHVAIVEQVYSDHIVFSEAVRNCKTCEYYIRTKSYTFDELNNDKVWLIP